ncbi:unnamed protein product [Diabrotica balteata]|uniref:Tryptophan synthase beta chain-like PALP domain-containing protein n=1 Tax=Diabrotica balteata TaxID=107213 RepID=A0A9N9T9S3_DIABA|nr:unnamed protein product [Diabrotica balteata]
MALMEKPLPFIKKYLIPLLWTNFPILLIHYRTTTRQRKKYYYQCDGKVDMIVIGCGTGGILTGIGRKFKELSPKTIIIGADPYGSQFAAPPELNKSDVGFFEVEGVGHMIVPTVCDQSLPEKWYKVDDYETHTMSRRLIREEGLLVGSSSGLLLVAAIKAIKDYKLGKGKRVVILLCDGTKNYLTKFVCDQWMEQRNLLPCVNTRNHWWWDINVTELSFKPCRNIAKSTHPAQVLDAFKRAGC